MTFIDICLGTTSRANLMADLAVIGITPADIGNGVALDYIGRMVKVPAQFTETGDLIQEEIYWDGERANLRLWGAQAEARLASIITGPHAHGTQYITPQPANPRRVWL